jgi:hypothetical protein
MKYVYRVHWTNHNYYADAIFDDVFDALHYGKDMCQECTVHRCKSTNLKDSEIVCAWSTFSGTKWYIAKDELDV